MLALVGRFLLKFRPLQPILQKTRARNEGAYSRYIIEVWKFERRPLIMKGQTVRLQRRKDNQMQLLILAHFIFSTSPTMQSMEEIVEDMIIEEDVQEERP